MARVELKALLVLAVVVILPRETGAIPVVPRFIPLGDLPGGTFSSFAEGISDDGRIVVGSSRNGVPSPSAFGGYKSEAFRWTMDGGMQGLGSELGERGTSATAISGDGLVITGHIIEEYPNKSASIWTANDGMKKLTGCDCMRFDNSTAVSYDGSVVVGRMFNSNGARAYRWTAATGAIDLGEFVSRGDSAAYGVSRDGTVVVGNAQTSRFYQAFRWTEEHGMMILGTPSNTFGSSAYAMSADASMIVGEWSRQAALWTVSEDSVSMSLLGDLPGGSLVGYANGISADGKVIIGTSSSDDGYRLFRWTPNSGMRSLQDILTNAGINLTGWQLVSAEGISADGGVIIGHAINPAGNDEGFVVVIPPNYVPEPSSFVLIAVGLGSLFIRQMIRRTREL